MPNKSFPLKWFALAVVFAMTCGCVKMTLRLSPSLVPAMTDAVFEECDTAIAEMSIPANLKILEGLLKHDPDNHGLLTSLSMGYTGYAMLFVEERDPERASSLYMRARDYGIKAMGQKALSRDGTGLDNKALRRNLYGVDESLTDALFWTTMSWNAWLNLNLDKPSALAQMSTAEACLDRLMELDADYFYGSPYVLKASLLSAKPALMGGNADQAKKLFDTAMDVSEGGFFLVHYFYARHYATRVQDKDLFLRLIRQTREAPRGEAFERVCLINMVMREKAQRLKERMDDLFF